MDEGRNAPSTNAERMGGGARTAAALPIHLCLGKQLRADGEWPSRAGRQHGRRSDGGTIAKRGFPDSVHSLEGAKHLIHRKSRQDLVSGTACAGAVIGKGYHAVGHGGPPPALVNCECGTAFSLGQGRVAAADFRGNDCAAVRPARRPMRPPASRFPFLSAPAAL